MAVAGNTSIVAEATWPATDEPASREDEPEGLILLIRCFKIVFKIVQHMAAGLPVVASSVGADAELVREGETVFLRQSTEGWAGVIARRRRDGGPD